MTAVTVFKLDHHGREVWRYPARVLARTPDGVRLEAYFDRDDTDLGFTTFARGDRFVECFYRDRWYNVFAIYGRDDDAFKGWYCNLCRPATITATVVRCEDLALDMWVTPAGAATLLDEDEFVALELGDGERARVATAVDELLALAGRGALPA